MKTKVPQDYSTRIKLLRHKLGLTQMRLAELMGVSFASVNRWENGQARPSTLAWNKIERAELCGYQALVDVAPAPAMNGQAAAPSLSTETITAITGQNLQPGMADEEIGAPEGDYSWLSSQDAPPTLLQAVSHTLLVNEAGMGKTIMAGLYIREMLTRELVQRVLIIASTNLLVTWKRELRAEFDLRFKILKGTGASGNNPFIGEDSNLMIASFDLLGDAAVFARLREPGVMPYDLAILDDAKAQPGEKDRPRRYHKIGRRQVAEALAGVQVKDQSWQLPWRAEHLLLLSAQPQMRMIE